MRTQAREAEVSNVWDRKEDESSKAFEAFGAYLVLGPRRSLAKAISELGRPDHYMSTMKRWSVEHAWVHRSAEYDSHCVATELAQRADDRERMRQRLVTMGDDAIDVLEEIMNDEATLASSRIAAAKSVLALAGMVEFKRVELTGKDGSSLLEDARQEAQGMDAETRARLRAIAEGAAVSEA